MPQVHLPDHESIITSPMPIGRAERFELQPRVTELFGEKRSRLVFELLELVEIVAELL